MNTAGSGPTDTAESDILLFLSINTHFEFSDIIHVTHM